MIAHIVQELFNQPPPLPLPTVPNDPGPITFPSIGTPPPAAAPSPVWTGIPNVTPETPPGGDRILHLVGQVKWGAGVALVVGFFAGLIVWAGGRWVDHHRAGRIGLVMMLCAIGGALLYSVGYTLISSFASGG